MKELNTTINKSKKDNSLFLLNNKALFILIVLAIIAQILTGGKFFIYSNLSSVFRQIAVTTILGIGVTVILASGEVDLSIGQMMNMIGILYGVFSLNMPIFLAIILALTIGALCGLLNGTIAHTFKVSPFILTLALAMVYKGFAYILCNGKSISGLGASVKYIGQGILFNIIPISVIITLALMLAVAIMLNRTKFGRHILATGGNGEASRVSGINIKRIRIAAYVIMGLCAALGSMVLTGRVSTALPNAGDGMEMDAIAAVVIGGTPMAGGKAKVIGTVFGCMIIGVISNTLNLMGVSSFWQWIAKGSIIVIAIILDSQTEAYLNKKRTAA